MPTEAAGMPARNARAPVAAARRRSSFARGISFVALAVAAVLFGLFVWQAGVLAPPAPQDVGVASGPTTKPEQITVENAAISGTDKNNRSYEIKAKSGEQDPQLDQVIHMQQVESRFERETGSSIQISSDAGRFDRTSKDLQLSGKVTITEGTRYTAHMEKAAINTDDQSLVSQSPVKVDMQGGLIEADSLTVSSNGTRILFKGGVKARFTLNTAQTGDGE